MLWRCKVKADLRGQKSRGVKCTLDCGLFLKAAVLPLLSWPAQILCSPGCGRRLLTIYAYCTKIRRGHAVVKSLYTPALEAVLSVPVRTQTLWHVRPSAARGSWASSLARQGHCIWTFAKFHFSANQDTQCREMNHPPTLPSAHAPAAALHASMGLFVRGHAMSTWNAALQQQ